jgi:C1A family cysteine protease
LWLKVEDAEGETLTVTWKINDQAYPATLNIGGTPWRTWATKTLHIAGEWTVTVTDAAGAALNETGVVYVTGQVHSGWDDVAEDGFIRFDENSKPEGGHAFLLVGYDQNGFWIQNSWGKDWGQAGTFWMPLGYVLNAALSHDLWGLYEVQ